MKKKFVSLLLALEMLITLSACGSVKEKDADIPSTTSFSEDLDSEENDSYTEEINPYESQSFYTGVDISKYLERIDNIPVEYSYEEYYPTLEDIKEYKRIAKTKTECPESNEFSCNDLIYTIINNTIEKYGNNNGIFSCERKQYFDDYPQKEAYVIQALYDALNNIYHNATNDFSEDICKLKGICIISKDLSKEGAAAFWDEDNQTIVIDYDKLDAEVEEYNSYHEDREITFYNYLLKLLEHELNHARQDTCKHRKALGQENDSVDINRRFSFILETSAESELYAYKRDFLLRNINTNDYSYIIERNYENYLLLIALFNNQEGINGYYDAIFDSDINTLFKFFELESDSDLLAFNRIMYSLDTLCAQTTLARDNSNEDNKVSLALLEKLVGNSYRQDLLKLTSKRLIKAVERDNLSLDESLTMYNLVRAYVLDGLFVSETAENNEDLYGNNLDRVLLTVDDIFIEFLSERFNCSYDDIKSKQTSDQMFKNSMLLFEYMNEDYFKSYWEYSNFETISPTSLVDKYPMIKNLLFTNACYYFYIDEFEDYAKENNAKKLVLDNNGRNAKNSEN